MRLPSELERVSTFLHGLPIHGIHKGSRLSDATWMELECAPLPTCK